MATTRNNLRKAYLLNQHDDILMLNCVGLNSTITITITITFS
ncbi:MAG: hypothetical protein Q8M45_04140 [Methylotenera sp.]|nr:hypothetical protein [Methylotenera sp.]